MREFLLPYGKETLKAEIEEEHLAGVLVSELHDYKAPMGGSPAGAGGAGASHWDSQAVRYGH